MVIWLVVSPAEDTFKRMSPDRFPDLTMTRHSAMRTATTPQRQRRNGGLTSRF